MDNIGPFLHQSSPFTTNFISKYLPQCSFFTFHIPGPKKSLQPAPDSPPLQEDRPGDLRCHLETDLMIMHCWICGKSAIETNLITWARVFTLLPSTEHVLSHQVTIPGIISSCHKHSWCQIYHACHLHIFALCRDDIMHWKDEARAFIMGCSAVHH